ncbi:MAG: hypothetical protein NTX42_01280 [Methanothrix sp.]|nr:hypothetical protein [Methanothrix sp.]
MFETVNKFVRSINTCSNKHAKNIGLPSQVQNVLGTDNIIQWVILKDPESSKEFVLICGIDEYKDIMNIINKSKE